MLNMFIKIYNMGYMCYKRVILWKVKWVYINLKILVYNGEDLLDFWKKF